MPENEADFDLIVRNYLDRDNTKEVNYFKFCSDVDRPQDIFPNYTPKRAVAEKTMLFGVAPTQQSTFFAGETNSIDVVGNRYCQARVDTFCDPSDAEDRIRAHVVMKRVRIEEFFRDFDKLRKGRVTRAQFKQILSSMNFTLTDNEFNAVADKYVTSDAERFFNYVDFVASINKVFTQSHIQKDPCHRVAGLTQADTLCARRKYLAGHDDPQVDQLLNEYRTAVANRRIHLKPCFADFDITKNGHVTKAQFLRVLNLLRVSAPESVTGAILKRYMDKGNVDEVNYVDFCEDVDSSDQLFGVTRGFNHSTDYFPKTQPRAHNAEVVRNCPDDVEDVLARIRQSCLQQRIRIGEFLRDFDKLRSGFITNNQFRIGLSMAKVGISATEFEHLCAAFKAPKEGAHMRWKDFCDAVDSVFTKKGLEKAIDTDLNDVNTTVKYGRPQADKDTKSCVQHIVECFTEFVRRHRLDSKSFFQDFDKHRRFKVSQKIFRQVLTNLGFQISDEEVYQVSLVYGNNDLEIQYAEFLKDCHFYNAKINGPTTGIKSTYVPRDLDFTGDKEHTALMCKIKNTIKKDRIRLLEFFHDHDILRKGYVVRSKFESVLHGQKLHLTPQEFKSLEDHYQVANDQFNVNYVDFCAEIDLIFTEPDLEKNPTKTVSSWKAPSILDPKDVLDESEEKVLHAALQRLGTEVCHRRILIKPFFQDKDRSNSGFINMTRFRSIFDNMKLRCSEEEFSIINRRFQAKAANEINYVEFDHVLRVYSGDNMPV